MELNTFSCQNSFLVWTRQAHFKELQETWFLSNNVRSAPFLPALEWWEIMTVDLDQGGRANPEFAEHH